MTRCTLPSMASACLSHWQALCHGARLPLLSSYLDTPFIAGQPWMIIIDVDDPRTQNIRFLGTGIIEFFGPEHTGQDFLRLSAVSVR